MLSWFAIALVSALLAHVTLSRERAINVSSIGLLIGALCGVALGSLTSSLAGEHLDDPRPVGLAGNLLGAFGVVAASLSLRRRSRKCQLAEARTSASSAIVVASSCVSTGLHR